MSASVLAFPNPSEDCQALLPALVDLHALITIDPILGASPVRILFALRAEARARVAASIDPADVGARAAGAYALIAYDFPFALYQFAATTAHIPEHRAKAIISCSAALQPDSFVLAAQALGLRTQPIPAFDATALKAAFFPHTQETVTHLFRLSPAGA